MPSENNDPNKQPFDNAAMQLRMNAFTPRHSPQMLVACSFFVAILFIPIGAAVILASDTVFEVEAQYDHINKYSFTGDGNVTTVNFNGTTWNQGVETRVRFTLDKPISPPSYIYYRIKGFYQNYREYSQSRSDSQIRGDIVDGDDAGYCEPMLHPGEIATPKLTGTFTVGATTVEYDDAVYNPCGMIAWSRFNDTISLYSAQGPTGTATGVAWCRGDLFDSEGNNIGAPQNCVKKGIALDVDLKTRFKKPGSTNAEQWTGTPTPSSNMFRAAGYYQDEVGHSVPNVTDEDYIVWARTGALPDFRKLYRRITTTLPAGDYVFVIGEHFPTAAFGGEKSVILATTSWMGGKNYVLGILLLVFGCLSLVLALAFFLLSLIRKPDSAAE